jgi:hypothetical protein
MGKWLKKTIQKMEAAKKTPECRTVWRSYFGLK